MLAGLLLLAAAAGQAGVSGPPAPGPPPPGPVEHLRQRVVEAIRNCRKPVGDEIVVCAKDRGVAEAYRLPKLDPRFDRNRERRVGEALAGAGAAGTGSCTNTGAGGSTGCALRDYQSWAAMRRQRREEEALP